MIHNFNLTNTDDVFFYSWLRDVNLWSDITGYRLFGLNSKCTKTVDIKVSKFKCEQQYDTGLWQYSEDYGLLHAVRLFKDRLINIYIDTSDELIKFSLQKILAI